MCARFSITTPSLTSRGTKSLAIACFIGGLGGCGDHGHAEPSGTLPGGQSRPSQSRSAASGSSDADAAARPFNSETPVPLAGSDPQCSRGRRYVTSPGHGEILQPGKPPAVQGADSRPFCIDVTEVTVIAYADCVRARKCTAPLANSELCNAGVAGKEHHPVNCITHDQASEYCAFAGGKLPSLAEWEWAASGEGADRSLPWIGSFSITHVCGGRYPAGTCEVGQFHAGDTPSGVSDLLGNVREWTATNVVDRPGASWVIGGDFNDVAQDILNTQTPYAMPNSTSGPEFGFRCAAVLVSESKQ
jgi:hypothetical protein